MKVVAAGRNLDEELLEEWRGLGREALAVVQTGGGGENEELLRHLAVWARREDLTPETLSAAYARISRDPRDVGELRRIARRAVERARRSNESIVYGLGHASVAEHAVFNVDVEGASRLAAEFIEHYRLASYTEKSQRYITLDGESHLPAEIAGTHLAEEFQDNARRQREAYVHFHETLRERLLAAHPEAAECADSVRELDNQAKEDARYALGLATTTQLGMTINARSVERVVGDAACHPLAEVRAYGQALLEALQPVAPSLIKYTEPGPCRQQGRQGLSAGVGESFRTSGTLDGRPKPFGISDPFLCRLVQVNGSEADVFAALALEETGEDPADCLRWASGLDEEAKMRLLLPLVEQMRPWDVLPRAFEMAGAAAACALSASCFAQFKRHRLASQFTGPYDVRLGVTVPPAITEAGLEGPFRDVMRQSERMAERLAAVSPHLAPYALTNAHRRRFVFSANLREWNHVLRLRLDAHAQWEIRYLCASVADRLSGPFPVLSRLLAGKDRWARSRDAFSARCENGDGIV